LRKTLKNIEKPEMCKNSVPASALTGAWQGNLSWQIVWHQPISRLALVVSPCGSKAHAQNVAQHGPKSFDILWLLWAESSLGPWRPSCSTCSTRPLGWHLLKHAKSFSEGSNCLAKCMGSKVVVSCRPQISKWTPNHWHVTGAEIWYP
jgi:hypothetical protein